MDTQISTKTWKTISPATQIEMYGEGEHLVYQMTGHGIEEQVGTSTMPEAELLDVLLSPLGMKATEDGQIIPNLGRIEFMIGIPLDRSSGPEDWLLEQADQERERKAHIQRLVDAGFIMFPGVVIVAGPFNTDEEASDWHFAQHNYDLGNAIWKGLDGLFYVILRNTTIDLP